MVKIKRDYLLISFISILLVIAAVFQGIYFYCQYSIANIITVIFAVYLLIIHKNKREIFKLPFFILIIFCLSYTVSYLLNTNQAALEELLRVYGFIFAFVIGCLINKKIYRFYHIGIVVSATIVALVGLLSYFKIFQLDGSIYNGRMQSTIQYANVTGLFLLIGFLSILYMCRKNKYLFNILSYLIIISIIMTKSRSIWLIMTAILLYIFMSKKLLSNNDIKINLFIVILIAVLSSIVLEKFEGLFALAILIISIIICIFSVKFTKKIYVIFIALIIATLFFSIKDTTLYSRLQEININTSELNARIAYYRGALKTILNHPVSGCGIRGWETISKDVTGGIYSKFVHNYYLQIACDAGLLALTAFLLFIIICLNKVKNQSLSVLIVISILVQSAVDVSMHFQLICFILFIEFGRYNSFCIQVNNYNS